MRSLLGRGIAVVASGSLVAALVIAFLPTAPAPDATPQQMSATTGLGSFESLVKAYDRFEKEYLADGDQRLRVNLVWNKSLSDEYTPAFGRAHVDLDTGDVIVRVRGLEDVDVADVWLVDNVAGPGRSTRPEPGDKMIHVGSMEKGEVVHEMTAKLDPASLVDFEINWVVVARKDEAPGEGGILFGSTLLFQRLFHYANAEVDQPDSFGKALNRALPASVKAQGVTPPIFPNAALINQGRQIFFKETFQGNGRTCGTCHPENHNFTIDAKFIATLPDTDPLFVAERPYPNPLAQLEIPSLMRGAGLILENTNGFDNPTVNFTMRGVPHTLALRTSLEPTTADGTTIPPDERTGWSGDGSPVDLAALPPLRGTLRDFAVGAVIQHFPLSLNRIPNVDFRLPTQAELDALEAFQLSLGRQSEFADLTTITLSNPIADKGRDLFIGNGILGGAACNVCHFNAGANSNPAIFGELKNRNFNTRVENLEAAPGDIIDPANMPPDDGFGRGAAALNNFNTPTVVEAADTGPFFHDNSVETIEAAVAFYTSERRADDGVSILPPITRMDGSMVTAVSAFLRVINAEENIRSALDLLFKAIFVTTRADQRTNIALARSEIEDAIDVLECGRLHCDDVVPILKEVDEILKGLLGNRTASFTADALSPSAVEEAPLAESQFAKPRKALSGASAKLLRKTNLQNEALTPN